MDNAVAHDITEGTQQSDAKLLLNGHPINQIGSCEEWRGVTVHLGSGIKATGMVWTICFTDHAVVAAKATCPNPWQQGEFERYQKAGYSADPSSCPR